MLADEPTGNLDSKNSEAVLDMLMRSNRELKQTVLMITHNPEAACTADRILHMSGPLRGIKCHGQQHVFADLFRLHVHCKRLGCVVLSGHCHADEMAENRHFAPAPRAPGMGSLQLRVITNRI